MSLANSKATAVYQEALAATGNQGWDTTGVGFTEKAQNPGSGTVSQQLNTLLFITIKQNQELAAIRDEVQQIHTRVKDIQKSKQTAPQDIKADLEEITAKLANLKVSGPRETRESGGKLKVFRNPYDILKEQK